MKYRKMMPGINSNNEEELFIGKTDSSEIVDKQLADSDADLLEIVALQELINISERVENSFANRQINSVGSIKEYITKVSDEAVKWIANENKAMELVFNAEDFCKITVWFMENNLVKLLGIKQSVMQKPEIQDVIKINKEKILINLQNIAVMGKKEDLKSPVISKEEIIKWLYKIRKENDYDMKKIKNKILDNVVFSPINEFKGKEWEIKRLFLDMRNDIEIEEEDPEFYQMICEAHTELMQHSGVLNKTRKLTIEETIRKQLVEKDKADEVSFKDAQKDIAEFSEEIKKFINGINTGVKTELGSDLLSTNKDDAMAVTIEENAEGARVVAVPYTGTMSIAVDQEVGEKGTAVHIYKRTDVPELIEEYKDNVKALEDKDDGASDQNSKDGRGQSSESEKESLILGSIKESDIQSLILRPMKSFDKVSDEILLKLAAEGIAKVTHIVNMKMLFNSNNENRLYLIHKLIMTISLILLRRGNPMIVNYYKRLYSMVKIKTYLNSYTIREMIKEQMLMDVPKLISSISRHKIKNATDIIEKLNKIKEEVKIINTSVKDMINDENIYYSMIAICIKGYHRSLLDSTIKIIRDKNNEITAEIEYWGAKSKLQTKQLHFVIGRGTIKEDLTVIPDTATIDWLKGFGRV